MSPFLSHEKINAEQRAAVTAVDGPSLVIAGPGSGKTRTLTVKALYILRHHPEARILCVTHTRKAADEMRARIARHGNIASIQVSTIHSLCYGILKKSPGEPIRVLSDYDHGVIVRLAAQTTGVETDQRQLATVISHAKLGLSACPSAGARAGYAQAGLIDRREEVGKLLREYERLKDGRLDYDDLLLLVLKKLKTQGGHIRSPTHILVDEAQDLDRVQIKLIKRLSAKKPNVTFFLDYNQAIFSFKGALPDEIERIANIYPKTRKFYLLRNHRSTGKILDSANRLIRLNGSENSSVPMREEGADPLWVRVADEIAEARLATDIALDLIQNGLKPRDILILYRTNHYRAEVESELIENEIPYSLLKNTSLFLKEGPFLPLCLEAWRPSHEWEKTLLRNYLGRRSAGEICSLARELKLSPFETAIEEAIRNPGIEKGLNLLLQDLREVQAHRDKRPRIVADVAWEIVQKRGFIVDAREARGLFRLMGRSQTLGEITEQIEKLQALSTAAKQQRLHLSTIHRAKGLEHRAVILLGCVEGVLPLQVGEEIDIPEERRLAYVALTRAMDLFVATSPDTLYGEATVPSRFISEMGLKRCEWVKSDR
jgi:DNA helicase-2/ATP-dependent DNA helicase PcrA